MRGVIQSLHSYPLKSAGGCDLSEAVVGMPGFPGDRVGMLIDNSNRFLSQRRIPRMALLSARISGNALCLEYPGQEGIRIPIDVPAGAGKVFATMHRKEEQIQVIDAGVEAAEWFSKVLGIQNIRLVWIDPNFSRKIPDDPGGEVMLADGYPYLITSSASLDLLNDRLVEADPLLAPLTMQRFRPNIVVDIEEPWAEMKEGLQLQTVDGSIFFRLAKPCQRCGIPQIDPATGERDIGSIVHKTLKDLCYGLAVPSNCFGQNAIPVTGIGEVLKTGMEIELTPDA